MNPNDNNNRGPAPEWSELEIVTIEGTNLAVRIQTTLSGRPAYSREMGVVRDGRFLRHIREWVDTKDGVVTVRPFDNDAAARLHAKATEVIRQHAQAREDEWQKNRRPQPVNDANRGRQDKPKRSGGRRRRGDGDDERWSS